MDKKKVTFKKGHYQICLSVNLKRKNKIISHILTKRSTCLIIRYINYEN